MTPLTLPPSKAAARRVVRAARRARRANTTDAEWARCGEILATGLTSWLSGRDTPRTVALYESLPTEPPTGKIRDVLASLDVRLLFPILLADKDLSWHDEATGADLGLDAIATADLVITPGLAVARDTGLRLGQGGGSYDRALGRVRPETPIMTMLFDDEVVATVPADPHDRAVHAVLTPSDAVRTVGPIV